MLRRTIWAVTFFLIGLVFRPFIQILTRVIEDQATLIFLNALFMAILGLCLGAFIDLRFKNSEPISSLLLRRRILSAFIGAVSFLTLWVCHMADDMDWVRFFSSAIVPLMIGGFIGGILELCMEQFGRSQKP